MLAIRQMGPVVRLGEGNLGGKARVLPFLHRLLESSGLRQEFAPHTIGVPETWVLTTDCFSEFVSHNKLEDCADDDDDRNVRRRFLGGNFSAPVLNSLKMYLDSHKLPLAVRSSALSEDTYHHATAGLYSTLFTPNRGPKRFLQLQDAIKLVFASAYYADVARYMKTHDIVRENEEMAVALESVVGTVHGDVFYPMAAGVAQSLNYFPVGKMKPEDGVATIVMGLGSRAVSGQDGMRICPRYPLVRPYFQQASDIRRVSQQVLDAVDLTMGGARLSGEEGQTLRRVPIEETEEHGVLEEVASVYDPQTGVFFDSLFRDGPRVLTFNRLLREQNFPLPTMLRRLLGIVEDGFGLPVEIEFALDLRRSKNGQRRCHFSLLQARPLPSVKTRTDVDLPEVADDKVLMETDLVLGHGKADGLKHIVFVDPLHFSLETSDAIAAEVARLNRTLRERDLPYLLLGPGRWGSCNKAVGVPVKFSQIDGALLIAELGTKRLKVEPSQGTHFFHNMVSRDLYYFTVDRRLEHRLAIDWLREQPNAADTERVKLIETTRPISLRVDGHKRRGLVYFAD